MPYQILENFIAAIYRKCDLPWDPQQPGITALLAIRGMERDNQIVFEVEDNGLGMSQEQLARILMADDGDSASKGIGISNVNERIKLYFGDEYGIQIRSEA